MLTTQCYTATAMFIKKYLYNKVQRVFFRTHYLNRDRELSLIIQINLTTSHYPTYLNSSINRHRYRQYLRLISLYPSRGIFNLSNNTSDISLCITSLYVALCSSFFLSVCLSVSVLLFQFFFFLQHVATLSTHHCHHSCILSINYILNLSLRQNLWERGGGMPWSRG